MFRLRFNTNFEDATAYLERARSALRDALERASQRALALLEERVVANIRAPLGPKPPAVAYGLLASSVFSEPRERPELGGVVAVHPPADAYAAAVEFGARAHFPPIAGLLRWVQAKFGPADPREARSRAFLVARSIARRGTSGHFMFQRAVEQERANVAALFGAETDSALRQLDTE
jgi:hypothetical protein